MRDPRYLANHALRRALVKLECCFHNGLAEEYQNMAWELVSDIVVALLDPKIDG
jgi:hypothetical protein